MVNIVKQDNPAVNQEFGGQNSQIRDYTGVKTGKNETIASPAGAPNTSGIGAVSVEHTITSKTNFTFHSHPSYGNNIQGPSVTDVGNATGKNGSPMTNYVFAMKEGKVYIYSTGGVKATLPISTFEK